MDEIFIMVLATRNKGKLEEMKTLLQHFPVDLRSLDDFGPIPEVEEGGRTFDDNAYKKAFSTASALGFPAIADDSGLVVKALAGAPGVHSARYAGPQASDADNIAKLLREMNGVTDRSAAFECVISVAVPSGPALTYEARCEGEILLEPRGSGGFGYDPLFYYPPLEQTFAQLPLAEKNQVSHRGKALGELARDFGKVVKWLAFTGQGEKPPHPHHE